MKKLALLIFSLSACQSAPMKNPGDARRESFLSQAGFHSVWGSAIPATTIQALADYEARKQVGEGLSYGESVRRLSLQGASLATLEKALRHCEELEDVLHDPKTDAPTLCEGKTTRQILFVCADGGLVRVKPDRDSCNKFRPQPHAVKSVRYPYDGNPKSFAAEAFKVDERGEPIPKSPAQLDKSFQADDWAEDAHWDLAQ